METEYAFGIIERRVARRTMHIRTIVVTATIGLAAVTAPTFAAPLHHLASATGNPASTAATDKSRIIGREQARTEAKRCHDSREGRDSAERRDDRHDAGEERDDD